MRDLSTKNILLIIFGCIIFTFGNGIGERLYEAAEKKIEMPEVNKETIEQNTKNIAEITRLCKEHAKRDTAFFTMFAEHTRLLTSQSRAIENINHRCDSFSKTINSPIDLAYMD